MPFLVQIIIVLIIGAILLGIILQFVDDPRIRKAIYGLCGILFILWVLGGLLGWGPGINWGSGRR